jgi:hypothetical protein
LASSSPPVKRATSGRRHAAAVLPARRVAASGARSRTSASAASPATAGTARKVARQPAPDTAPASGIPAIHAAGIPAIAHASTWGRRAGAGHSKAAAIPTATSSPTPTPSTACAQARTAKLGAAALSSDPAETSAAPALSSVRSPGRRGTTASAIATRPPVAPETDRSWPAVASDTPNSLAMSGRIGDSTSSAACDANRQRKTTGLGRDSRGMRCSTAEGA